MNSVADTLAQARLDMLRQNAQKGSLREQYQRTRVLKCLKTAIETSLFLEDRRKKMWINGLSLLTKEKAQELLDAILRENIRYKKGVRTLQFKKIPERVSEEVSGDFSYL